MLPQQYLCVRDRIQAEASKAILAAESRLQNALTANHNDLFSADKQRSERLEVLDRFTVDWLTTGIAKLPLVNFDGLRLHGYGWGHYGFSWRRYMRDLAGELHRPVVYMSHATAFVQGGKYNTVPIITVQKFAYTRPLIAGLLLLPKDNVRQLSGHNKYWEFWLQDTPELAGQEVVDDWLRKCAADPDMRRALRLP